MQAGALPLAPITLPLNIPYKIKKGYLDLAKNILSVFK
jgi:hypothetical protein